MIGNHIAELLIGRNKISQTLLLKFKQINHCNQVVIDNVNDVIRHG